MTRKVNPTLFRLGINKKPVNFLFIDKNLNKLINQQSWLFILNYLKKIIIHSLKYVIISDHTLKKKEKHLKKQKKFLKNKKKEKLFKYNPLKINRFDILNITFENITHNHLIQINKEHNTSITITTLKIDINLFDKYITNHFLIKRKLKFQRRQKLKKKHIIKIKNRLLKSIKNLSKKNKTKNKYKQKTLSFNNPTNNKYLFKKKQFNKKLNNNKYLSKNKLSNKKLNDNKYLSKNKLSYNNRSKKIIVPLNRKLNFQKKRKLIFKKYKYRKLKNKIKADKINWIATENYITNNLYYIFNSQLKKFTKNTLFQIYCNIKFTTTPNLSATLELEKIKKELESLKPLRIPQIFQKALSRSKQRRSKLFKTTKSLGIKIRLTGRFNGAERSRSKIKERGRVTIKSYNSVLNYDYGFAKTKYGVIGIKVWIDQGQSILWKNNTQLLSILKKNITIKKFNKYKKRKIFKKIRFKKYSQLKYLTNFYLDLYEYQTEL